MNFDLNDDFWRVIFGDDVEPVNENLIEGRNAVMEAFRAGRPIDKLFVLDGCQDGS